ncbi:MAG: DoxX family protein [Thiohalocapsa sp.]
MIRLLIKLQDWLGVTRAVDFLGPLALRLYLAPIFWVAGTNKVVGFDNTVAWFGNPDWGLGLPLPTLMAVLATGTEVLGAIFLLLGFAVRLISIPLMATMLVAMLTVHSQNGWQAIADSGSAFASPLLGIFQFENAGPAGERLSAAKEILREHGNYEWLTEAGNFVVLNSGIEFAATYFVMLLVLFFIGAGRYLSIDYWLARRFCSRAGA